MLQWIGLGASLVLLNISLTFTNIWPTLGIRLTPDLSVELAVILLAIFVAHWWKVTLTAAHERWLAVGWLLLVLGRYGDVTARSLYGRDINLFWDVRHMPNVGAMFAAVADPLLLFLVIGGVVVVPLVGFAVSRWAFRSIFLSLDDMWARSGLFLVVVAVLVLRVGQGVGASLPLRFSDTVSQAYVRELSELAYEMSGAGLKSLAPPTKLSSDLSLVTGADVFLVFLESYGTVSWDQPEFVAELSNSRDLFVRDITETGRSVVSARVESTTFGGESWLAHISLLSGTEVRDPGTNKRLMAQDRDTLVKVFGRNGYRTVAVMPGLQRGWPQGKFYGFDDIYDHSRLDYQGPPFGWWDLNDQFALARLDQLEVASHERRPVFVFFSTVTSHAPFVPTPPYQPDWKRVLSGRPYDEKSLDRAWSDYPDWLNLGPSYIKALRYAYETIGGYFRLRQDRDIIMILAGDHQPPSLVSGEGASWDVPVHVVASRPEVLERLRRHAFVDGLAPTSEKIARMDTLLPMLLDAFGESDS